MDVNLKNFKNEINNEDGQSIFELVLFLPIFLYLVVVLLNVGNSINASINQQKATRGYTHYLVKGNSYGFTSKEVAYYETGRGGIENLGAYIIGWRFKEGDSGNSSIGTYYNLPNVPFSGNAREDCSKPTEGSKTHCIKVFTFYGLCGETYSRTADSKIDVVNYPGSNKSISDKSICVLN